MTTQHTQGRLESSHQFLSEGAPLFLVSETRQIVARIENRVSGRPLTQEDAENARRLVACWNACEGISTTEIEAAARSGSISHALERVIYQRNELLGALKWTARVLDKEHPAALKAYAAIAKAEGGVA